MTCLKNSERFGKFPKKILKFQVKPWSAQCVDFLIYKRFEASENKTDKRKGVIGNRNTQLISTSWLIFLASTRRSPSEVFLGVAKQLYWNRTLACVLYFKFVAYFQNTSKNTSGGLPLHHHLFQWSMRKSEIVARKIWSIIYFFPVESVCTIVTGFFFVHYFWLTI